ncbi:MAG: serpin family protein, partial [Vicinamibacterales bacterium]|nr:serpin family protein [Vicinamibacterales bacterium]
HDGAPLQSAFLEVVTQHYDANAFVADFVHRAEDACVAINRWAEDKTRHRITDVVPPGSLHADTRLVLVNAMYFKAAWALPFRREATRDEPFRLDGGRTVQVPLMYQQRAVRYLQASQYQAVDLDYQGVALSMLMLLPNREAGLQSLETVISARMLDECVSRLKVSDVLLSLPRFKFTFGSVNLLEHLATLGMELAFDRLRADFSGINGFQPPHEEALVISGVFHKAFVDANEEGTEAAAVTDVRVAYGARVFNRPPPVPVFRADHPFVFAIRDRKSGAVLFLGRVSDPTR